MAKNSKIEWTTHTFNPWRGCTKVSPGCANCYAEKLVVNRLKGEWGPGAPRTLAKAATWREPLAWNREAEAAVEEAMHCFGEEKFIAPPRPRVFCASLADWLDDEVPVEWLARLLEEGGDEKALAGAVAAAVAGAVGGLAVVDDGTGGGDLVGIEGGPDLVPALEVGQLGDAVGGVAGDAEEEGRGVIGERNLDMPALHGADGDEAAHREEVVHELGHAHGQALARAGLHIAPPEIVRRGVLGGVAIPRRATVDLGEGALEGGDDAGPRDEATGGGIFAAGVDGEHVGAGLLVFAAGLADAHALDAHDLVEEAEAALDRLAVGAEHVLDGHDLGDAAPALAGELVLVAVDGIGGPGAALEAEATGEAVGLDEPAAGAHDVLGAVAVLRAGDGGGVEVFAGADVAIDEDLAAHAHGAVGHGDVVGGVGGDVVGLDDVAGEDFAALAVGLDHPHAAAGVVGAALLVFAALEGGELLVGEADGLHDGGRVVAGLAVGVEEFAGLVGAGGGVGEIFEGQGHGLGFEEVEFGLADLVGGKAGGEAGAAGAVGAGEEGFEAVAVEFVGAAIAAEVGHRLAERVGGATQRGVARQRLHEVETAAGFGELVIGGGHEGRS